MKIKFGADHKWTAGILFGIPILAGILAVLGTTVSSKLKQERVRQTQALLDKTTRELVHFQSDCGFYPSADQGLAALVAAPSRGFRCRAWQGPYSQGQFEDAWGAPLVYSGSTESFSLKSLGADRVEGGEGADKDITFGGYE